jgi:hypothetical protein
MNKPRLDDRKIIRLHSRGLSDRRIALLIGSPPASVSAARYRLGLRANFLAWNGKNVDPKKKHAALLRYAREYQRGNGRIYYRKNSKRLRKGRRLYYRQVEKPRRAAASREA